MRTREEGLKRKTTGGMKFGPMSEARKLAISKAKKGIPLSPKDRARVKTQLGLMNKGRIGKPRPNVIREKIRNSKKGIATSVGETNGNWAGDSVQYPGIHQWLKKNFGKANQCQNQKCLARSPNYDWARLRDVDYKRQREYFVQLCRSCHRKYDLDTTYEIDIRDLLSTNQSKT